MTRPTESQPLERSTWRSVALPREHGGWGLTLEPCLLGLIVAWSPAGLFVALAAAISFLARSPLRVALVDLHRGRSLDRTKVARRLFVAELFLLVLFVVLAVVYSKGQFWVPNLIAAPMILVAFWYDMRSRGRRLLPELAGSLGICSVAAMIVLADGDGARLAAGCWLVLGARALTSIPYVRSMIMRLHGRSQRPVITLAFDAGAVAVVALAAWISHAVVAGAVSVAVVVLAQRLLVAARTTSPKVIGMRQMVMGLCVVATTATGVLLVTR